MWRKYSKLLPIVKMGNKRKKEQKYCSKKQKEKKTDGHKKVSHSSRSMSQKVEYENE